MIQLHHGDCLDVLRTMPDASVDAIVTDPPYGLRFMGKKWDYDVPTTEVWAECLRVLKPGGHLLAFAGTRTQHRMAVRIEDAGFEIRDMIAWVYGSGFPKSLDISKQLDRMAGVEREVVGSYTVSGTAAKGKHKGRAAAASDEGSAIGCSKELAITAATPEAQQWAGWGTALKPSFETVTWATKPFPPERERARILANLWKIEARLWLLSSASAAAQSSTSSQSEYVAACATAQWTADDATNTRAALRGLMDTWQCEMAIHTSLSIVSSWRRTLEESLKPGSTSTTETESSTTTDWKTLSCCLSEITPESIIQACSLPGGFNANASTAAQIFNASLALLQSTLTLSAIEPATWQELGARQGEDVRPSLDPVIMARKPLEGTVAANVLQWGTGGINVDGCRVGTDGGTAKNSKPQGDGKGIYGAGLHGACEIKQLDAGRWPANLLHDGSDEVVGLFPGAGKESAARFFYTAKTSKADRNEGCEELEYRTAGEMVDRKDGSAGMQSPRAGAGRTGGGRNAHPTVKPVDLMCYLCRLVTPPGGIVLDPFMGSGSTGKACVTEGFSFIGIERDADSFATAQARVVSPMPLFKDVL